MGRRFSTKRQFHRIRRWYERARIRNARDDERRGQVAFDPDRDEKRGLPKRANLNTREAHLRKLGLRK